MERVVVLFLKPGNLSCASLFPRDACSFVVRGHRAEKIFLAYRPRFDTINGRFQLIVAAQLMASDPERLKEALEKAADKEFASVFLRNSADMVLDDIQDGEAFDAEVIVVPM